MPFDEDNHSYDCNPTMKQKLKAAAIRLCPRIATAYFRRRTRRHIEQLFDRMGLHRVARAIGEQYGNVVQVGPFAGMKYDGSTTFTPAAPKLIGSYEAEVQPWIERLCATAYNRILDLGCAEGYYVVGMALRNPDAEIFGYDTDPAARDLCVRLAAMNGVSERVSVRAECKHAELDSMIMGRTLVICDIDGGEQMLLDPARSPGLANADILVELHDMLVPGTTEIIRGRFSGSHKLEQVTSGVREPLEYPTVAFLSASDRTLALAEMRNDVQDWLLMLSHRHSSI